MIQPIGYYYLWRDLYSKPIWANSTPQQKVILITLLGMANFKEKKWEWKGKQYVCKPGQFVTSLESIANEAGKGISIQNVRTALKRFQTLGFLTSKSTNRNRLITIENWERYQADKENQQANKQATNKQLTTKEEGNKVINIYTADFEKFYDVYPRPTEKKRTFTNWSKCIKEYSPEEIKKAAENYKAKVEVEKTDKQYIKTSANFLGRDKFFEDYIDVEPEKKSTLGWLD